MTVFFTTTATPTVYGWRIFVQRDPGLFEILGKLSTWRGYDKVWNLSSGDWYGYEFISYDSFMAGMAACVAHGLNPIDGDSFYQLPPSPRSDLTVNPDEATPFWTSAC